MSLTPPEQRLLRKLDLDEHAGPRAVDAAELQRELGLSSLYLARRMIRLFDGDGDGTIPRAELLAQMRALMEGPKETRLAFAFRLHDEDGNGFIDRDELLRMLHIALAESRLLFGDPMVEALADTIFDRADVNHDGQISCEEFQSAIGAYPGVHQHLSLGDLGWLGLAPSEKSKAPPPPPSRVKLRSVASRATWWILLAGYLLVTIGLFVEAFLRYRAEGADVYVQLARGCGAALNFQGALIIVPLCRWTLTRIGRLPIGRVMIDDHVAFHRMVGNVALALGVGHGVAHGLHAVREEIRVSEWFGWAVTTGCGLLVVHLAIWFFARERVRRSGRFELFHFTHRLYPLWFVLLLLHGSVTWMWMAVPVGWFVIDRFVLRRTRHTVVQRMDVLASGVTRLTIQRPEGFEFRPADYVYLRIPAIAESEWHPFTISSAPERSESLTLHVRSAGNWTHALQLLANARTPDSPPLACWLDGPHGTASAKIFESKVVLLVAAGIGVTPFASVVSTLLWHRVRGLALPVQKVHFVWICREQQAFEWFSNVLGQLEQEAPDFFDVHVYMDAGRSDLSSAVLRVAMDSLYASVQADLITGLRAKTILGRPNWKELVGAIKDAHPDETVDCFYCGPAGLATVVRDAAHLHGLSFRQEHF